jgi:7-carboxy-7-deazaguanine synthase
MKINLVKNGIFAITKDINGNPMSDIPDTGYNISGVVQGEGKLLGMPCLFIRTSACNLRCSWVGTHGKGSPCDTPYSSHHPEKNRMEVDDIIKTIMVNAGEIKHIVVSGGEPTMQDEALTELLQKLQTKGFHTTIETNATIYTESIARYTNLVSMSPKLSSSTPHEANLVETGIEYNAKWAERHEKDRINIEVIQKYIKAKYRYGHDFQLKFVVTTPEDIVEIKRDFLDKLENFQPEDVCLMPEGITPEELMSRTGWVVQECLKNGWRFTPRLHTLLFGTKRGV